LPVGFGDASRKRRAGGSRRGSEIAVQRKEKRRDFAIDYTLAS
jgi:hypothetical protein